MVFSEPMQDFFMSLNPGERKSDQYRCLKRHVSKQSPVEAMALTAAAGATLAATGLFLGLRSRKRNERL